MKRSDHKNLGDTPTLWMESQPRDPSSMELLRALREMLKTWMAFGVSLSMNLASIPLNSDRDRKGRSTDRRR